MNNSSYEFSMPPKNSSNSRSLRPREVEAGAGSSRSKGAILPSAQSPAHPLAPTRRDTKAQTKPAATQKQPTEPPMVTMEPPIITTLTPEDEALLLQPPHGPEPAKKLLALRQTLKRVLSNRARAQSHLQFTAACLQSGKTPRGLTIKTKCQALLKEATNVEARFERTTATAEKDYVDSLHTHYTTIVESLNQQEAEIQQSMEETLATITERHVVEEHKDLLIKTMANCSKLEDKLEQQKKTKRDALEAPPTKKTRKQPRGTPPPPNLAGRVSTIQTPSPTVARAEQK